MKDKYFGIIILSLIFTAVAIATAVWIFRDRLLQTGYSPAKVQGKAGKIFLASVFNNKENYSAVFKNLQKEDAVVADAGLVSHHFLAKQQIADFYNKIRSDREVTIFLLSPNHYNVFFDKKVIAYSTKLTWQTPFGELDADNGAVDWLNENGAKTNDNVFGTEHGIYVEVPFIKKFFPNAKIVPLILRQSDAYDSYMLLGKEIKERYPDSIIVASTDFSHDKSQNEAKIADRQSLKTLKNLQSGNLQKIDNDCRQCLAVVKGFLGSADSFVLASNTDSSAISGEKPDSVTSYVFGYFAPQKYIKIALLGDIMLDRGIRKVAQKNGYDFIFEKISAWLANNGFVVANLEGPVTDRKSVSIGTKPGNPYNLVFTFDPLSADALAGQNINLVNLGNNHSLDFYHWGLLQTQDYLKEASVDYFGASNENKTVIKNIGGFKVAFVSFNQFSENENLEQISALNDILDAHNKADYTVVFCHWGKEYDKEANDFQKEWAHKFIDAGANLVVGSHPHVVQEAETYKGKKIYYSLGNFVFDQYFSEEAKNGLALVLQINKKTGQASLQEQKVYLQENGQTVLRSEP